MRGFKDSRCNCCGEILEKGKYYWIDFSAPNSKNINFCGRCLVRVVKGLQNMIKSNEHLSYFYNACITLDDMDNLVGKEKGVL